MSRTRPQICVSVDCALGAALHHNAPADARDSCLQRLPESKAVLDAYSALQASGVASKYASQDTDFSRRRNVFLGELKQMGIKNPDQLAQGSTRSELAFIVAVVGEASPWGATNAPPDCAPNHRSTAQHSTRDGQGMATLGPARACTWVRWGVLGCAVRCRAALLVGCAVPAPDSPNGVERAAC
jgi:hypothetical protein